MSDSEFEQLYFDDVDEHIETLMQIATKDEIDVLEVRRIMHAMEGAAGLMNHDSLRVAIFEICKRIERACSPSQLSKACEVFRECNDQLRKGEALTQTSEELVRKVI